MSRPLTRAEARAFRRRWQLVNAREVEELRNTDLDVKWRQFNTLLAWAQQLGWTEALREGDEEVRQRWVRLRADHPASAARASRRPRLRRRLSTTSSV
jgi:hypothetical protein